jgi:hypothetical protein
MIVICQITKPQMAFKFTGSFCVDDHKNIPRASYKVPFELFLLADSLDEARQSFDSHRNQVIASFLKGAFSFVSIHGSVDIPRLEDRGSHICVREIAYPTSIRPVQCFIPLPFGISKMELPYLPLIILLEAEMSDPRSRV